MARLPYPARILLAASGVAVVAASLLMAMRVGTAISLGGSRLVVTSGAEEEAVMSLFRAMAGEPYADPSRLPFSASYYNFLFYAVFGGIGRLASWAGAPVEWLPTVWRLVSLVVVSAWLGVALAAVRIFVPGAEGAGVRSYNRLAALFVAVGPLVGFWAVSYNPELAASALSALALVVLAARYDRSPLAAVAAASALSLAAWSFKQSYLFAALALGLFLLLRRDWRGVGLVVVSHALWVAAVLAFGSEPFRRQLLSHVEIPWAGWQLARNLQNLGVKVLPFLAGTALALLWGRRRMPKDTAGQVAVLGLLAALPALPFSAKVGASENYFFLLSLMLAVMSGRATAMLAQRGWPRWATLVLAAVWLVEAAACLAVVSGRQGAVSLDDMHRRHLAQRSCVADLPAPFYATDSYLVLPWMHPAGPHIVPAYYYADDRQRNRSFENGGIGGMIAASTMASVAVPHSDEPPVVDGTPLSPSYLKFRTDCAGLDIWVPAGKR